MKKILSLLALAALTIGLLGSCKKDSGPETPKLPEGALPGVFSVSATKQVHFSKGNLVATIDNSGAPTAWKFATNQYDYIGNAIANKTIGIAAGDVDFFGWSTASTTYGISTSETAGDYSGDFMEWGKNIGDGNTWRTLTNAEWKYLFNNHVKVWGQCNSVNGYFIAPDGYEGDATALTSAVTDWASAEAAGIVFLPAAGRRDGSNVYSVGACGYYWSSSAYGSDDAFLEFFNSFYVSPDNFVYRNYGYSVRLITDVK